MGLGSLCVENTCTPNSQHHLSPLILTLVVWVIGLPANVSYNLLPLNVDQLLVNNTRRSLCDARVLGWGLEWGGDYSMEWGEAHFIDLLFDWVEFINPLAQCQLN